MRTKYGLQRRPLLKWRRTPSAKAQVSSCCAAARLSRHSRQLRAYRRRGGGTCRVASGGRRGCSIACHQPRTSARPWRMGAPATATQLPRIRRAISRAREALAFSAVELLVERIAETVGGFALTDREATFAVEICRRSRWRAARTGVGGRAGRSLHHVANSPRAFATGSDFSPTGFVRRCRAIGVSRAVLEWSCQLLSEAERMVLRRLSVFPAWFDMRDATQICTRLGMSKPAVVEAVASLVTKSIATADVTDEGARYRLPETVRAYSREKLDRGQRNSTRRSMRWRDMSPNSTQTPQFDRMTHVSAGSPVVSAIWKTREPALTGR